MTIKHFTFDSIILGGGGAGLTTAIQLGQEGLDVAVISKVFPTRSHTAMLKEELLQHLQMLKKSSIHDCIDDSQKQGRT